MKIFLQFSWKIPPLLLITRRLFFRGSQFSFFFENDTNFLPQYISLQPQNYEKITTKLNFLIWIMGGEVSFIINRQVTLKIWSFRNAYLWSSTGNSAIFVCLICLHLFLRNQTFCKIHKLNGKYLFLLQSF